MPMILPHDGPLQQRQLLPIVTGLLGSGVPTLSVPSVSTPPLSSILPLPSLLTGSSSSLSSSSPSSSFSSISVSSTTSATSTVSSTTSTSTSTSSIPSITITPSLTTSDLRVTTSGGSTITVVVNPTNSATPILQSGFLQNKTVSGVVFAIVGVVALVIIIAIVVFAIRRRNHNRLMEAISFDPGVINAGRGSTDKASIHSSGSDRNVQPYGSHRPYYAPGAIAPNYPRL